MRSDHAPAHAGHQPPESGFRSLLPLQYPADCLHVLADCLPNDGIAGTSRPHVLHCRENGLLFAVFHQPTFNHVIAELYLPAAVEATGGGILLHFSDTFSNAIPLFFLDTSYEELPVQCTLNCLHYWRLMLRLECGGAIARKPEKGECIGKHPAISLEIRQSLRLPSIGRRFLPIATARNITLFVAETPIHVHFHPKEYRISCRPS